MNPYRGLPPHHFWSAEPAYDPTPKWTFDLARDRFATAGSCFAQHISRAIRTRGGHPVETETAPAIIAADSHGYGLYPARYGNIYTCRQFRQLLEQAFGETETIFDLHQTAEGRWLDLLRLRAIPEGFSSEADAVFDRRYHLERVAAIFAQASVFVFTLGLTETWLNARTGACYPICPAVVDAFAPQEHVFRNLSFGECLDDLREAIALMTAANPDLKILLTVSPVMLVATYEPRGALQSSVASKAILRVVADQCAREFENVDYFPSFEIITGPQAQGRFYKSDLREVTADGVAHVMDTFFATRVAGNSSLAGASPPTRAAPDETDDFDPACDEILLGRRT